MTNQTPESVIAEVIEYHADAIDTHGPGCYKNHAACLAVKLRDMLREPGGPDAALAAVERVRAVLSAWEMVQARNRECLESGNPGMIVPIDCTGGLRAALDGAPEPEDVWEYGLAVEGLDGMPEPHPTREAAQHVIDHPDIYRKWTHGNPVIMHRRRKAGPWLPVEGESE